MKTGHTPSRTNPEYWESVSIPWFTLADVWQLRDGRRTYLGDTSSQISELGLANSAAELLPPGTVVLSRTASVGFSGVMPIAMATSQDFWNWVCGPDLIPEYLNYQFKAIAPSLRAMNMGSTHQTIYQRDAASIEILVPPIETQRAIVDYLEPETERIDTLIDEQQRLIELLRERRQAQVDHAVWAGIDGAPLIPSPIDPVPRIPRHWRVLRNKNLLRESTEVSADGTEELLSVSHLTGITPRSERNVTMTEAESLDGYRLVEPADLVINTMWAWMGALGVSRVQGIVSPAYGVYRPIQNTEFHPAYFDYLYRSRPYVVEMTRFSRGIWSSRLRIYPEVFLRLNVVVPPMHEQRRIANYLDEQTAKIDALTAETEKFVELSQERRAALISAAVTGQLDVPAEVA